MPSIGGEFLIYAIVERIDPVGIPHRGRVMAATEASDGKIVYSISDGKGNISTCFAKQMRVVELNCKMHR